ncbi:hypothetical protein BV394_14250 [Brevirhabdus pacifica]|uniref:Uncharacterized protein n=1 Tax=Brevirhabdus pacifica TaxID=1267768 RepID=A0A1U7DLG5_9RHOB|nr:Mth938-like domain-containing protein [Brevirhabdus pacifica]APX90733.1 hypothetical protein BV394_14250 [Brevirhabdus pacifica]OWU78294.1 hypothetical protein ATO5_05200 [Loktanella sp. 22II-4b]PJJ85108.1 uncharacterized protein CLV77_1969 [Brevirhabdus pacifica]
MQLNEIRFEDNQPVAGYGPGFFRVGAQVIEGPVLLLPEGVYSWRGLEDLERLEAAADSIDVLFLGMGAEIAHAPAPLRERLEARGVGIEVMASPPACRTYNILLSEGRRVGAALLPV